MNKDKLKKLIYDMESEIKDIESSIEFLEKYKENEILKREISNSLKYKYLSLFILYEDFISMLLKEFNLYKIGITVDSAIKELGKRQILTEKMTKYLNTARLLRNRIGHRYKQLSIEVLVGFLTEDKETQKNIFEFIKSFQ